MPRKGKGSKPRCQFHKIAPRWAKFWWRRMEASPARVAVGRIEGLCRDCHEQRVEQCGPGGSAVYFLPADPHTKDLTEEGRKKFDAHNAILKRKLADRLKVRLR